MSELNDGLDIAIIGMAGRFPGAGNIEKFWELLKNGVEAVTFFTDEELLNSGVDPSLIRDPHYIKSRCIIEDEDKFDARFFDFFPREVEMMDPQHRLFLESAWTALENAGYTAENFEGMIGLFGGVSLNTYLYSFLMAQKGFISSAEGYQLSIGNDKDFLTTRVSYKLNLTGPSLDVQTACSTSLVAAHLACQNLLNYSCDMALAGGVSVTIPQKQGYYYQEGMILSADGHCRAFDHKASGTISGSGVGLVVLKRLSEALEDGDHIYAVIKGSAFNNDGSNRVGYTAPSVDGQSEVIANALGMADVNPDTISYIEAHGTGTVLGDPIEITALTQVFQEHTQKKQFCAVGSVKTNIGHLDAAAGVAGLIKTALSLQHKQIPASLNFEKPNPKIDFQNSPFYVNHTFKEWQTENGTPRRAGLSSFGIGGTNVHMILEEAPQGEPSGPSRPQQLLLLSAKTATALEQMTDNLAAYLKNNPQTNLADGAFTLQVGRKALNQRRFLVTDSVNEAAEALAGRAPKRLLSKTHQKAPSNPPVVFMFSGQGSQYVNMARELYDNEAFFRREINRCCKILQPQLNLDLRTIIYPRPQDEAQAAKRLNQTALTQPALFVIEYALAKLWMHWGVEPTAMVGHSIGEYVAACLAGVFSLEDALKVVAARGALMQKMPAGAMLSVQLNENAIQPYLSDNVSIGALNSEGVTVISGAFEAIEQVEISLKAKNVPFRRLHTSHAFHSKMMDPILDEFEDVIKSVKLNTPQLPYLSNTSGSWISVEQATDSSYYAKHLRNGVRFMDNIGELLKEQENILLEVGPGTALATLARRHPANTLGRSILSSVRHPHDKISDEAFLLEALGKLWLTGVEPDWFAFYEDERRARLALPTYPFERQRFWLEGKGSQTISGGAEQKNEGRKNLDDWFYIPSWKQRNLPFRPQTGKPEKRNWLIFKDNTGLSIQLVEQLQPYADAIVLVESASSFVKKEDNFFGIRADKEEDYQQLFTALDEQNFTPDYIIHLWNVAVRPKGEPFNQALKTGFISLVNLAKALEKKHSSTPLHLGIVSSELFEISGWEKVDPALATLLGPSKVIAQEFPHIICRNIDAVLPQRLGSGLKELAERLVAEFTENRPELALAYRGKDRWVQQFDPVRLDAVAESAGLLDERGVYLITGGLGRIGLTLARYLGQSVKARLALLEFFDFPAKSDWPQYLLDHDSKDILCQKIHLLQEIEQNGAEILIIKADVADEREMAAAIDRTIKTFGALDGIIHAAGLVGNQAFKAIPEIRPKDWNRQFQAKIFGAVNLAKVISGRPVKFVLLQSSMSAILGGLGFAAYAAANAFLDSFAHQQNKKNGARWLSVNWDGWNFGEQEIQDNALGAELAKLAILPEEGLEVFARLFSYKGLSQVLISTGNLQQRIDKWLKLDALRPKTAAEEDSAAALHSRPDLATAFVEPETELQKEIAATWQKLLGIQPIGLFDDFFDLGGNSLMGTQLISKLRQTFQIELPLRSLFEDPTIAGISKIIEQEEDHAKLVDTGQIANLLSQIENLSEEEAKKMLEKKKKNK